jgi:hypothetical protein
MRGLMVIATAAMACGGTGDFGLDAGSDAPAPPNDAAPKDAAPKDATQDVAQQPDAAVVYAKAWAFGDDATRLSFDGTSWSVDQAATTSDGGGGASVSLTRAWASADQLWVVGTQWTVQRFENGAWEDLPSTKGVGITADASAGFDSGNMSAVWGTGDSDVWVLETNALPGNDSFLHWDGSQWTRSSDTGADLSAMSGTSSGDIWAAGNGGPTSAIVIFHDDGSHWTKQTAPSDMTAGFPALLALAPDDVYVGAAAHLWHWNGAAWASAAFQSVTSFFGTSSNLWAATPSSTIHFDGTKWTPAATDVTASTLAVGGASTKDMWAVGKNGDAAHFDGATWTAFTSGTTTTLHVVIGVPNGLGK